MIVTAEQRQTLYKYLDEIFTYRETLAEVYDHVLSSLENYDGDLPYQEAVTRIIQYDFGGTQKLVALEKIFRSTVAGDIHRQFRNIFFNNLITIGVALTLMVCWAAFYVKFNLLATPAIVVIAGLYFMLTTAHYLFQPFRTGYLYGDKKESVKDKILTRLFSFPARLPWILFFLDLNKHQVTRQVQLMHFLNICLTAMLYVLLPVFIWSYYQAFKKDYSLKFI